MGLAQPDIEHVVYSRGADAFTVDLSAAECKMFQQDGMILKMVSSTPAHKWRVAGFGSSRRYLQAVPCCI